MSRLPRILLPGIPAHVVHRGNNRQAIFLCESDYLFFYHCLREAARLGPVQLHAYVLMPNHFHLLVTPETPEAVSDFVQSAARRYVGYFNSRQARTGTLWEGRFHSSAIEDDFYLLACHRYIDSNPVRAGLVETPGAYRWSSHRHYAEGVPDSLLACHPLVETMARDVEARQEAYRGLFEIPLSSNEIEAIRSATQRGRALGASFKPRSAGRPKKMVSDTIF